MKRKNTKVSKMRSFPNIFLYIYTHKKIKSVESHQFHSGYTVMLRLGLTIFGTLNTEFFAK